MRKIFFLIILMFITNLVFAYDNEEGKAIFASRCTACHSVEKNVVGPALMDVDKRRDEKWIIAFVHSSQRVIKSGDTAAVNLYTRFNNTPMPDHPDITDDQVRSIISYIKTESSVLASKPKQTIQRPHELQASYKPIKFTNYTFWSALLSSIGLLVWSLLLRVKAESLK